jgi:hypothetical protein
MLSVFFLIQTLTGHPACAEKGFDFDTFINVQSVCLNCHSGIPQKSGIETWSRCRILFGGAAVG